MSVMTVNNGFHNLEYTSQSPPKPSSPSSPSPSASQPPSLARPFINGNIGIRGQNSPFPTTPISGHTHGSLEPPPGVSYSDFIRTWTDNHVARWLADIKCGMYADTFKASDIRGDILLDLGQDTLQEMGVVSIGDKLRIIDAVKFLRQRAGSRFHLPPAYEDNLPARPSGSQLDYGDQGTNQSQEPSPSTRLPRRPAPLLLFPNNRRPELPGVAHDQLPDSAKVTPSQNVRPLPQIGQPSTQIGTPSASSHPPASSSRTGLPPLPPPPRGQPPLPPPNRPTARGTPVGSTGRHTPTQTEPAPPYTSQGLPPAPPNQAMLTPSSASWSTLPSDPRPSGRSPAVRPMSPQPPGRPPNRIPPNNSPHIRNGSLGNASSSPPTTKLPQRPSTGNTHPYANAQASLHPPTVSQRVYDLSPIAESFMPPHSSAPGTPSPPSVGYSAGRAPFNPGTPSHNNAPSLDDLRRKLVKFIVPDEGISFTIDVAQCTEGVEVLEKVLLKKYNKGGWRAGDSDIGSDVTRTDAGGLSVDGWGVFLDMGQVDGPGEPLTEAELLSICHAPPDHPRREHGLTLRRTAKVPLTPHKPPSTGETSRSTKRASSISILSGLGVRDPEKALDPPSPTHASHLSPAVHNAKRPSKLRNFFGQRPPSELITTHLTEYFPFTEKKVLERTARHSMMLMRSNTQSSGHSTRRDSSASWNPPPPLPSRFSTSTQGSQNTVKSPTSASFPPAISSLHPPRPDSEEPGEEIPRMSLSTEDGQSVELEVDEPEPQSPTHSAAPPQLLPPIPFPGESFSESLESITGTPGPSRPVSRTASIRSHRMSYMTEFRNKRDRSDTASLMTVDEITAEVESRRESMTVERASDVDDWTTVDPDDGHESDTINDTPVDETEEETLNNDDEDDDSEIGKAVMSGGNKWIKGALIGAGSFGKVYLGMDAANGLLMAVKQVELPSGAGPNQARKKSMLSALEREIELLKNLQHENIVQYLYSSIDDEYLNIFLEYVPGGSVAALLHNYGAFEETLVKNFVRQILQGLNYLHERDIVHRDIKGANILVDNKGGIKISDFGISKKINDNLLTDKRVNRPSLQGSVFWMAPEVVKQSGHTRKADIWSVGCLVVEMLTGEHPWAKLTQMQAIFKVIEFEGISARH
ncbi:hypothetical protein BD779DRAFT_1194666 [Infundibulicybe gibba]|nr:hypothetical protein BD779DRAFT_1194666 [Infundibulicybe gibba]